MSERTGATAGAASGTLAFVSDALALSTASVVPATAWQRSGSSVVHSGSSVFYSEGFRTPHSALPTRSQLVFNTPHCQLVSNSFPTPLPYLLVQWCDTAFFGGTKGRRAPELSS